MLLTSPILCEEEVMRLFLAAIVMAGTCTVASAEDWSRVRCEDPKVVEFIKHQLAGGRFEDGTPVSRYLGDNSKLSATTVSAQKDRFVCKITIAVSYAGNTQRIRARFVLREFPNGKISTQLLPY